MRRPGASGWHCGDSVSIASNRVRQAGVRTLTAPVMGREELRVCIYIQTRNATSRPYESPSVRTVQEERMSRRREASAGFRGRLIVAVALCWRWCQAAEIHRSLLKHREEAEVPREARFSPMYTTLVQRLLKYGFLSNCSGIASGKLLLATSLTTLQVMLDVPAAIILSPPAVMKRFAVFFLSACMQSRWWEVFSFRFRLYLYPLSK